MDDRVRVLVRLAASMLGDDARQVLAMDAAAAVDPTGAEEVLLQSHLFLGYPASLNGLSLWRRRTGRPAGPGATESFETWQERGQDVCGAVYGHHYEALRELMGQIHPDLDQWAVTDGYGKVLGRPGLDLRTRELCIAAQLAGTGATRQLHAHLRGCLNVGASVDDVDAMLAAVSDLIGPDRAREAGRVWDRVRMRWSGKGD